VEVSERKPKLLRVEPLYEKTECLFGGILKSISLSLTLNKLAIECRLEDRRVIACELLMDQERRWLLSLTDSKVTKAAGSLKEGG
jgi:hypothetical protein